MKNPSKMPTKDSSVRQELGRFFCCDPYWFSPSRKVKASTDNAMPTIKTDSDRILVVTDKSIGIPDVRDIERLQGYPEGITKVEGISEPKRRRMLGDTVTVPLVRLIARMLRHYDDEKYYVLPKLSYKDYIRPPKSSWQEKSYYE